MFVAGMGLRDTVDAPGAVAFLSLWPATAPNARRVKPVKLVPYGWRPGEASGWWEHAGAAGL
jgi:hypothetical protein